MSEPAVQAPARRIRAVLFDNDGTLVDSEYLCNLALQQQFESYGVALTLHELIKHYRGGKLSDIFSALCKTHHMHRPANYETEYRARLQQLFSEALKPVAGAAAVLAALKQQQLQLAVVSNGPQSKMRFTLAHCGLLQYFCDNTAPERLFSAYDCNLFKPDPALYLYVIQALGLEPADCVIVEDSQTGVQAGLAAGVRTYFLNHYDEACPDGAIEIKQLSDLLSVL
jgi:HAD superfamily hydrolase (TIGR01509 family)